MANQLIITSKPAKKISSLTPFYQFYGYGTVDHERLGADFLCERGFSKKVARLIEHHVNARCYPEFKKPDYFARLSEASLKTLAFQGGSMTADKATAFEKNPYFRETLQVRGRDEQAKISGIPTPDMTYDLTLTGNRRSAN